MVTPLSVPEAIRALGLERHPEGGWYRETWRAAAPEGRRPAGTAIYFLLEAGERNRWHRVDADETWHWYAGAPLRLSIATDAAIEARTLGPDLAAGARPQATVPAGCWQQADAAEGAVLAGCTVAPGFVFEGFEMAPDGWEPGR